MTITIPLPTNISTYISASSTCALCMISKRQSQNLATTSTIKSLQGDQCCSIPFIVWDWRGKAIKVFLSSWSLIPLKLIRMKTYKRQTGIFFCKPSSSYCWHAFLHIILFKSISFNRNTTFMASTTHHPGKAVIFSNWDCIDSDFFLAGGWKSQDIWAITGGEVRIGQTYFCIWNIFPPQPAPQIFVHF